MALLLECDRNGQIVWMSQGARARLGHAVNLLDAVPACCSEALRFLNEPAVGGRKMLGCLFARPERNDAVPVQFIRVLASERTVVLDAQVRERASDSTPSIESTSGGSLLGHPTDTVVHRISNLESNLIEQSNAIGGLRDASVKTDQNLQKMLLGIEKLCDQKSQTIAYPPEPPQPRKYTPMPESPAEPPEPRREEAVAPERARPLSPEPVPRAIADDYPGGEPAKREGRPDNSHSARFAEPATTTAAAEEPRDAGGLYTRLDPIALRLLKPEVPERNKWRIPVIVGLFVLSAGIWALYYSGALQKRPARAAANPGQARSSRSGELRSLETRAAADPTSEALQLELGREYVNRKDWARAENAYRSILRVNPRNREAVLALSDVLYQQQKYEESASVLSKLSSSSNP